MDRIYLSDLSKLEETLKRANRNVPDYYAYIFVPAVRPEFFAGIGLVAVATSVNDGTRVRGGTLLTNYAPNPVPKRFQVSYKAGSRWGSRVVMAESQEAANQMVKDEINASIGARPVR